MHALCNLTKQYGPLIGRILITFIFIMGTGSGPLSLRKES